MNGFHQFMCKNEQEYDVKHEFLLKKMVHCLATFDYKVKKLKKFLKANRGKNLFDFDMSNPDDPMYEKNIVRMLTSAKYTGIHSDRARPLICELFKCFVERIPMLRQLWTANQNFLSHFLPKLAFNRSTVTTCTNMTQYQKLADISVLNDNELTMQETGLGSYLFAGMLDLSCDPNVLRVLVNNKSVYYACKPIKAGSQIYYSILSFSHQGPKAERQEVLKNISGRGCDCIACKKNWPTFDGLRAVDPFFQYRKFRFCASLVQIKRNIARNNEYVDKNYIENDPTQEVYITIHNNFFELCSITRPLIIR